MHDIDQPSTIAGDTNKHEENVDHQLKPTSDAPPAVSGSEAKYAANGSGSTDVNGVGVGAATLHSSQDDETLDKMSGRTISNTIREDSDRSSSSMSAPPPTGRSSNVADDMTDSVDDGLARASGALPPSSPDAVDMVKDEDGDDLMVDEEVSRSDDMPSTTVQDFDADPALWGLRRSGRAPKKVYVDSSAGEESDDGVHSSSTKTRPAKNGKAKGELHLAQTNNRT
jgi:hypothetical protein